MIGKTISHYKIIEKIGSGGMGTVYKAEDTKLNRIVALKFLPPELTHDQESKERFIREAHAASSLEHDNICTIHEINETDDGQLFIVMACYEGQTLKEKIKDQRLKTKEAIDILTQIAKGLQKAHEKGIVHRDIKPANLFITEDGSVKILDFGLAKLAGQAQLTKDSSTLGTVAYMSPEQLRGEEVDHRTDIWSLGVVLYEMIAGEQPFKGDYEQAVMYAVLNEEPKTVNQFKDKIYERIISIVDKALTKDAEGRYQNAFDMWQDLKTIIENWQKGSSKSDINSKKTSVLNHLLKIYVPQVLGIYIIVSMILIQVIKWLVNHYPISPHLPDFGLIALLSFSPIIIIITYVRGRSGKFFSSKLLKIGIPINLILTIFLLFIIFNKEDLGAITESVSFEDSHGNVIENVIPKNEFRKRLALFFFDNQSGDPEFNWLKYGLTYMIQFDLNQDLFVTSRGGFFTKKISETEFEDYIKAPVSKKKQQAQNLFLSNFFTGSFNIANERYVIQTRLYHTESGKLISKKSFTGNNLYKLVDSISVSLRRDLGIPEYHIHKNEDLPIAEILTNSFDALRFFCIGLTAENYLDDFNKAINNYEQAIALDSTFAIAYLRLVDRYRYENRFDEAKEAVRAALEHRYRLHDIYVYSARYSYYLINDDWQSAFEILKKWATLYPHYWIAQDWLASAYIEQNKLDQAIKVRKRILEYDPASYNQWKFIGELYEKQGKISQAMKYLHMYANKFPDRIDIKLNIGSLYETLGDFENARINYNTAQLLEPDEIEVLDKLADLEVKLGNFKLAFEQYYTSLELSGEPKEKSIIYQSLINYYNLRGQIVKALDCFREYITEFEKSNSAVSVNFKKIQLVELYVHKNNFEQAFRESKEIEKNAPPFDQPGINSLLYLLISLSPSYPTDLNEAELKLDTLRTWAESKKLNMLEGAVLWFEGQIHHAKGNYHEAIRNYNNALEYFHGRSDDIVTLYLKLAKSYTKLREFDNAIDYLNKVFKLEPFNPHAHYEMALNYYEKGHHKKAMVHLNKALSIWEDADEDYKPAFTARETLKKWTITEM